MNTQLIEQLEDAAEEWARHVVEDTAPQTLARALAPHIKALLDAIEARERDIAELRWDRENLIGMGSRAAQANDTLRAEIEQWEVDFNEMKLERDTARAELAELNQQHIERLLRIETKVEVLIAERDSLLERLAASQKEELGLRAMLATVRAQEPVAFLCDATRFKVFRCDGDETGRILGLPKELNGRWVALVAADDDCHLNAVASPDVGALVEALKANHEWHQLYDDHGGYPGGALEEQNIAALTQSQAARVPRGWKLVRVDALTRWRNAFAEELSAWDIDPPIHHVKAGYDEIEALLAAAPGKGGAA